MNVINVKDLVLFNLKMETKVLNAQNVKDLELTIPINNFRMKVGNITLIIGETYFTKFGNIIEKLKLDKIHHDTISGSLVKVSVRSFPKKPNEKSFDSWLLWSSQIYVTRDKAKKGKN